MFNETHRALASLKYENPTKKYLILKSTATVMTQSGPGLQALADRCHRSLIAQIDR